MDGILLVDKPKGITSLEVVNKIKRVLKPKKIGHAGTLDPFATGLLIILLNQGTKLFNFISSQPKLYLATVYLGIETDSYDCTGKVIKQEEVPSLSEDLIKEKLKEFVGNIEQVPPPFSALKYKGVRAYKLARRGIKVELKKRNVTIYELELIRWNNPELEIKVRCSAGTYIRSLAVDIARSLNSCGHLKELRRISCGHFHVNDALKIEDDLSLETLEQNIIPLIDALPDFKTVYIDEAIAWRLRNGVQPRRDEFGITEEGYIKFVKEKELVAIAEVKGSKIRLERVFH